MLNFFDIANIGFFSIFSREETKRFYAEILTCIQKDYLTTPPQDMDRQRIRHLIRNILSYYPELADKEDQEYIGKVYRRLIESGWLTEERDDMDRYIVRRTKAAIPMLQAITEVTVDRTVTLGGYLQAVEQRLRDMKTDPSLYNGCFRFAFDTMKEFLDAVDQILAELKLQAEEISKTKNLDELLKKLEAYIDEIIEGKFYRLQFEENWTTLRRQAINSLLTELEENERLLDKLAEDLYQMERAKYPCMDAAVEKVWQDIQEFRQMVDMIEVKDIDITRAQTRYQNNAKRACDMLVVKGTSTSARINTIVKALEMPECENSEWYQLLIDRASWIKPQFMDESSLFVPRTKPRNDVVDIIPIDSPDFPDPLTTIAGDMEKIINQEKMDKLVGRLIGEKKQLTEEDLKPTDRTSLQRMVLIAAFSSTEESKFQIEFSGEMVETETCSYP